MLTASNKFVTFVGFLGESRNQNYEVIDKVLGIPERKPNEYPGIYIYDHPIKVEDEDTSVFMVELSGYAQLEDREKSKLLGVMFLICSVIVYGSCGPITDLTFETMQPMASLLDLIEVYEGNKTLSDLYLESYAPFFVWALYDLPPSLRTDPQGQAVSPSQYLEEALQQPSGSGLPQTFVDLFKKRQAFDFGGGRGGLNARTVEEDFRPMMLRKADIKIVDGIGLDSLLMVSYINAAIDGINSGNPVNPPDLLDACVELEMKEAFTKAKLQFVQSIKKEFGQDQLYLRSNELENKIDDLRQEALNTYSEITHLAAFESEVYIQYSEELENYMDECENAIKSRQLLLKNQAGEEAISNFEKDLESKLKRGLYNNRNFEDFHKDLSRHMEVYETSEMSKAHSDRFLGKMKHVVTDYMGRLQKDYATDRRSTDPMQSKKEENKLQLEREIENEEKAKLLLEKNIGELTQSKKENSDKIVKLEDQISKITREFNLKQSEMSALTDEGKKLEVKEQMSHKMIDQLKKELEQVIKSKQGGCCG